MILTRLLQLAPRCALLLAVACGDDLAVAVPVMQDDSDSSTEDDAEGAGDSAGGVDADDDSATKVDARAPTAGSTSDGGTAGADDGMGDAATAGADDGMGDAATSSADAGPTTSTPVVKPKCMAKDSQLIVVGDSYINWISHTFPDDIVKESGQKWRMEAIGGTSMGSGGIGFIPDQFYSSIKADPDAHTMLMDGGGNDILVADPTLDLFHECQEPGSSKKENCQKIVRMALEAADKLTLDAAAKGIRDVVYFFYPRVPANTILSGSQPNEILEYALPMVRDFCAGREARTGGKLRCHFVDMVPLFEGHMDWFNEDIHPNSMGSQAMATHLWEFMKGKCIGQKAGTSCCES